MRHAHSATLTARNDFGAEQSSTILLARILNENKHNLIVIEEYNAEEVTDVYVSFTTWQIL